MKLYEVRSLQPEGGTLTSTWYANTHTHIASVTHPPLSLSSLQRDALLHNRQLVQKQAQKSLF